MVEAGIKPEPAGRGAADTVVGVDAASSTSGDDWDGGLDPHGDWPEQG